jgi:hypothetical protein
VDTLTLLGRALGFTFAAGVNLYATVALLGLSQHYGWVALPEQFRVFDHPVIIGVAIVMYAIEFLADKIPWVDSVWDAVHTIVRPIGGALIAVAAIGHASPAVTVLAALLGGTIAGSSHLTKAGTRVLVNASPEPFSNILLSLAEDGFVLGLGYLALRYPLVALAVVAFAILLVAIFAAALVRLFRRRFRRKSATLS